MKPVGLEFDEIILTLVSGDSLESPTESGDFHFLIAFLTYS